MNIYIADSHHERRFRLRELLRGNGHAVNVTDIYSARIQSTPDHTDLVIIGCDRVTSPIVRLSGRIIYQGLPVILFSYNEEMDKTDSRELLATGKFAFAAWPDNDDLLLRYLTVNAARLLS